MKVQVMVYPVDLSVDRNAGTSNLSAIHLRPNAPRISRHLAAFPDSASTCSSAFRFGLPRPQTTSARPPYLGHAAARGVVHLTSGHLFLLGTSEKSPLPRIGFRKPDSRPLSGLEYGGPTRAV